MCFCKCFIHCHLCVVPALIVSREGPAEETSAEMEMEVDSSSNPIFIRGEPIAAVTAICCTAVELYCLDSDMLISLGIRDDRQVNDLL